MLKTATRTPAPASFPVRGPNAGPSLHSFASVIAAAWCTKFIQAEAMLPLQHATETERTSKSIGLDDLAYNVLIPCARETEPGQGWPSERCGWPHGRDKTGGGGELEQTCETAATEKTHLSASHPSTHEHRRLSTCNGHIVYAKTGPFVGTTLECLYSMLIPSTLNGVIMIGHSRWRCLPFPRKQFKRQDGCCVPAVLGDTKSVVFCVYVVCAVCMLAWWMPSIGVLCPW